MYKQLIDKFTNEVSDKCVQRLSDTAFIPFDPANTDYQNFKADLATGVVLNNADGFAMTAEQITEFLQGLN
jgi:hypothetical protein